MCCKKFHQSNKIKTIQELVNALFDRQRLIFKQGDHLFLMAQKTEEESRRVEFRVRTQRKEKRIVEIIKQRGRRMKLPDFSKNDGLNELRQQMGAKLISWNPGGDWKPINIDQILVHNRDRDSTG